MTVAYSLINRIPASRSPLRFPVSRDAPLGQPFHFPSFQFIRDAPITLFLMKTPALSLYSKVQDQSLSWPKKRTPGKRANDRLRTDNCPNAGTSAFLLGPLFFSLLLFRVFDTPVASRKSSPRRIELH